MNEDSPIRNIGILAHVDAGKTTLTEHLLFESGAIRNLGSVDQGTSQTDSLDVERERGISVRAASTALEWKGVAVRIIDTPGHADFYPEVERALRVLDGAVLVVSSVEGVQLQTTTIWAALRELGIPTLIFVNKLDRVGARPAGLIDDMRRMLSAGVLPVQVVSGAETRHPVVRSVRGHDRDLAVLGEHLASLDDRLMEKYARDEPVTWPELAGVIRRLTLEGSVFPVLYGAAMVGIGVAELLDAIVEYLPSPGGRAGNALSGLVFRIQSGEASGRATHVRVFDGTIERGRIISYEAEDDGEKPSRVLRLMPGGVYQVAERLEAGDIGALYGLRRSKVGQVLGSSHAISTPLTPAEPMLTARIAPRQANRWHDLYKALRVLEDEDPLLSVEWLEEQREISIRFFGEVQMEIIHDLLASRFGLEASFSEPLVIYKETPSQSAEARVEYRTHGYAIIHIRVDPLPPGSGFQFASEIQAEEIYHKFMKQIPQILEQARRKGPRGWEVTDLKVTVLGGHSKYDLGTKPGDFKIVTPMVLERALQKTGTRLLEPMLEFQISVPEEYGAAIARDLTGMRARFAEAAPHEGRVMFSGQVPFAETFRSTSVLYATSHGQGVLRTRFGGYSLVEFQGETT